MFTSTVTHGRPRSRLPSSSEAICRCGTSRNGNGSCTSSRASRPSRTIRTLILPYANFFWTPILTAIIGLILASALVVLRQVAYWRPGQWLALGSGAGLAAVVALSPDKDASEEDIIAFCKERLAAYKYPRSVEFLETLPKGPTGKILKRELRDPFWEGRERRVN